MTNVCVIVGRLTKDPELRSTQTGKSVAAFSVANDYGKTASGEKKTAFIECVAWGRTAEFLTQYFKKGDPIAVTGTLTTRMWEKDGQKRKITEIEASAVNFVPTAREKPQEPTPDEFVPVDEDDGELPF